MAEQQERPRPGDYPEISRGSAPAAILLFLHIAVCGYLGFIMYYLVANNTSVFWNLLPLSAALTFYFPAWFAILTYLPSDNLTRTVAIVARCMGGAAVALYGFGVTIAMIRNDADIDISIWITIAAILTGVAAGVGARVVFGLGIRGRSDFFAKK